LAWYRCFIRGENFPGDLVGEGELLGFYVTRFVEAGSETEAESTALQALRSEPKLARPPELNRADPLARVYFEEICEVLPALVPNPQPGFSWYPMKPTE
jgi:hypothetical protein